MMEKVEKIKQRFKDKIDNIYVHNKRRVYIDLKDKNDIKEIAQYVFTI